MWSYAVISSTYICIRCYSNRIKTIPYEILLVLNQIFPTCIYLGVFAKKLDDRNEEEIFVRYDKYSPAYLTYFPEKEVIKIARTVKFIDKFSEEYSNLLNIHESENNIMIKNDEMICNYLKSK